MSTRTVRLLHVEDDRAQRLLVAKHLKALEDLRFDIACAASEDDAVAEFGRGGVEFVILDYNLTQGNGLNCLRRIRARDQIVPVVTVSGAATAEVAAELVETGADDFISKWDLDAPTLARSVRAALARADAYRQRVGTPKGADSGLAAPLRELCREFLIRVGPDFLEQLDGFETAARRAGLGEEDVHRLFPAVCTDLDAGDQLRVRPLLLEVLQRIGDAGAH